MLQVTMLTDLIIEEIGQIYEIPAGITSKTKVPY